MRKYWCRRSFSGSDGRAYVIMVDCKKKKAFWFITGENAPFALDETNLDFFKEKTKRYPSLYQPITKKQFLLSRIAGKFIE